MPASDTLFKRTVNDLLTRVSSHGELMPEFPSESALAESLEVSRTTVRKAIARLKELGVVSGEGRQKEVLRRPKRRDFYPLEEVAASKAEEAERHVLDKLARYELRPGQRFSELELAKQANCNTITMREALLRVSRFGLIEKSPRQQWQVVTFDARMIDELISMREVLEGYALRCIVRAPRDAAIWPDLRALLKEHLSIRSDLPGSLSAFPELDRRMHEIFLAACHNRYIDQFSAMSSFLVAYQLRPQRMETRRVRTALQHHITIISALLEKDEATALATLSEHLEHAKLYLAAAGHKGENSEERDA